MKKIRFAVCGAGQRGTSLSRDVLAHRDDVEICGIFDPYIDKSETLSNTIKEITGVAPKVFSSSDEMYDETKPDAVLVAASWVAHIPLVIDAMNRGIPCAMEVGGVSSEEECRELIEAYERTKTPFMFLENCCFGRDELFTTAVARSGKLGNIVYCHGAYMHDLREEIGYGDIKRHYRLHEYSTKNCDNYPTHDLGPIAIILNINRGNRMVSLTSRASKAIGLSEYVNEKDELSALHNRKFAQGDIVETLITCENGELISLRLDTTLPTYYSREFTVRGTKGLYTQDTNMLFLDGDSHSFETTDFLEANINSAKKYYDEFLPDIWKNITPEIIERGHGGMDWFEFEVFCDCLRKGEEMPIDVYDAAAWMSISYLSQKSIALGGIPVDIPDFTNGAYKTRSPRDVITFKK